MTTTEGSSAVRPLDAPRRRRRSEWLIDGIFFAALWTYVWLVIDPRLIYDAFGIYLPYPEFTLDRACFREAWFHAGGLVEYLGAFLSQAFWISSLGALVVVAMAALLCLGTNRLIRDIGRTDGGLLSLVPALGVLVLYRTYHHPLSGLAALALCLWLAAAYQRMVVSTQGLGLACARWPFPARIMQGEGRSIGLPIVFLATCLAMYCLAGTVCVLFGALVGTWLACARRRVVVGLAAVVASALVPWWAGTKLYWMTAGESYRVVWPFNPGAASDMDPLPLGVLRGLFLFPLAVVWAVAVSRKLPAILPAGLAKTRSWAKPGLRIVAELVLLIAAVAALHLFVRAPHRAHRFQMVHFALERQWEDVLRTARQLSDSGHDCFSLHLVHRALFHSGRLADEMFSFPPDRLALLLLDAEVPHGPPKFWMLSEIAWELGDYNWAEQWAFERLEAVGECPGALELLARVCLAKDQVQERSVGGRHSVSPGREAARMFLRRMSKNLIYGRRAQALLDTLDEPPAPDDGCSSDAKRAVPRREDRVFQTCSEELMLESLLRADPCNRMAFEYLMAFYLLNRRTDKIVQNLVWLDALGYREIPRHYEEAILIHANASSERVALHGRTIRPETIEKFQRFADRFRPWMKQPHLAAAALADEFGDSYFYYYAFGVSGRGRSR